MAGGPINYGPGGPPLPNVPGIYRYTAKALGAAMWFFIFYRAKKDFLVQFGFRHPWDH